MHGAPTHQNCFPRMLSDTNRSLVTAGMLVGEGMRESGSRSSTSVILNFSSRTTTTCQAVGRRYSQELKVP
jgi:hypothetical protein